MTDAEPITRHVWLPDGRSLCDRFARPAEGPVPTPEEFDAGLASADAAAACGPCLLLVERLRVEAAAIIAHAPGTWPEAPSAAWTLLAGTRWAERLDVVAFSGAAGDDSVIFDAFEAPIDRAVVERLRVEWAAERQAQRNALIDYWTPSQDTEDGT
jgi:hypothetical protein